jgi:hypothetical protein
VLGALCPRLDGVRFAYTTQKVGLTQSLSSAFGVGGRFPFFAFESKLSTLKKKNAPPTSLERRLCPLLD